MKQIVMVAINVGSIEHKNSFLKNLTGKEARKPFGINFLSPSSSSIF